MAAEQNSTAESMTERLGLRVWAPGSNVPTFGDIGEVYAFGGNGLTGTTSARRTLTEAFSAIGLPTEGISVATRNSGPANSSTDIADLVTIPSVIVDEHREDVLRVLEARHLEIVRDASERPNSPRRDGPSIDAWDFYYLPGNQGPRPDMSMEEIRGYFQRVTGISAYILDAAQGSDIRFSDNLEEVVENGPNHYYADTIPADGALLLEMAGDVPSHFYTPFGGISFSSSTSSTYTGTSADTALRDELIERFGLVEVIPKTTGPHGVYGPVYAVTRDLEGRVFPMPQIPLPKAKGRDHTKDSRSEWAYIRPDLDAARASARTAAGQLDPADTHIHTGSLGTEKAVGTDPEV